MRVWDARQQNLSLIQLNHRSFAFFPLCRNTFKLTVLLVGTMADLRHS